MRLDPEHLAEIEEELAQIKKSLALYRSGNFHLRQGTPGGELVDITQEAIADYERIEKTLQKLLDDHNATGR